MDTGTIAPCSKWSVLSITANRPMKGANLGSRLATAGVIFLNQQEVLWLWLWLRTRVILMFSISPPWVKNVMYKNRSKIGVSHCKVNRLRTYVHGEQLTK